jgi:hypothetical protein
MGAPWTISSDVNGIQYSHVYRSDDAAGLFEQCEPLKREFLV